jgi:hypothetical protein
MCCGCGRFLQEDGTLTMTSVYESGVINLTRLPEVGNNIASFHTHADCDKFALTNKWSVRDLNGMSNHRCPDCRVYESSFQQTRKSFQETERTGAYVESWRLGR